MKIIKAELKDGVQNRIVNINANGWFLLLMTLWILFG